MYDRLTQSDIKKMEEEIENRKVVVRHELLEFVKEARSHGDLSENFEYHAAKKEKNQNEGRIRHLERMIRTAVIIDDQSAMDEVGMNDTITLFFEEDKIVEKYKIVTTIRQNALKGLVSIESPIGKALVKHKVNDRVYVKVNDNSGYYVIIQSIAKSEGDAEDKIREY